MNYKIINARIVNEGKIKEEIIWTKDNKIEKIGGELPQDDKAYTVLNAKDKLLIPGLIDDQVHFREPGLEHKADIYTESRAAIAGGITSFMEMPNTKPQTTNQELLEEKFRIASEKSFCNYSFYLGATNENIQEIEKIDPTNTCGLKIFMGSSTGNMLVDNQDVLQEIFAKSPVLIAVHCEDENTIHENTKIYRQKFGDQMPIKYHPDIRSAEACYISSSLAVELAEKHNTRLHLLHLSTAKEMALLRNDIPDYKKRITAEVCIHHLWFDHMDYDELGTRIKWNPAIKSPHDRIALLGGLLTGKIDVVATDHAPHTLDEKQNDYFSAPSGGPLVQHALPAMLEMVHQEKISLEKVVDKMCHAPARIFQIEKRGFIREGYYADLVLIDMDQPYEVNKNNILYKCGWSPFEGQAFQSKITHTWVNGYLVHEEGKFHEPGHGKRLIFNRS